MSRKSPIEKYYKPIKIEAPTTGTAYTAGSEWDPTKAAWTIIPGAHRGFLQAVSGNESFQDGQSGEKVIARFYCPVNTPSEYRYRITQNGQSYIMLYQQPAGISGLSRHKEVLTGAHRSGS